MALYAWNNAGDEPARLTHLDYRDQRAVRVERGRDRLRSFNFCMGRSIDSLERRWCHCPRRSPHSISKRTMRRPTRRPFRGRLIRLGERANQDTQPLRRGSGDSMYTRKAYATREAPRRGRNDDQLEAREGGFVVPLKPGNFRWREGASVQDRRNTW